MAKDDRGMQDSYKENGIEYVSAGEFAKREYVSLQRIRELIKSGVLTPHCKIGRKTFLNWKIENKKFQKYIKISAYKDNGLKPKRPRKAVVEEGDTAEVAETDTKEQGDVPETTADILVDTKRLLQNFDPNDFKDCFMTEADEEGNERTSKDEDGNPILNWVIVDKKITALIRNLELKRKESELISLEDVTRFLSIAFTKTQGKLSNIPDRYASRFAAFFKKETGGEASNTTLTALKNMLTVETKNILSDLSKEIENSDYS